MGEDGWVNEGLQQRVEPGAAHSRPRLARQNPGRGCLHPDRATLTFGGRLPAAADDGRSQWPQRPTRGGANPVASILDSSSISTRFIKRIELR
jgi:hypothetical protein